MRLFSELPQFIEKFLPIDEPFLLGGKISMVLGVLCIAALLTYFKKWKWLWKEWLTSLDPKKIGVMYLVIALVMLVRGILDALMMRATQALAPETSAGVFSADTFQQVFTAHGSIMIFFVAMGLMFGIINLILPLQLGARDVAFPFLNSVSFWLFAAGALLMNLSLVIGGEFAATGWLAYPPLSERAFSPGPGVDYWIWSIQIAGIGSLLSGVNFFTTIIKMRAPGMTMMKMPIFAWSVLGSMILVMLAFPILTATLAMLALDRTFDMHFFTATGGGNPMMYVNLIWAWGHPEVYILILPAFGIFSEIVATFSKKRLFGYKSMVVALMAITVLSFLVWLHHFFTMGAGANVNAFFGIMTMVIAVPTGVKMFNWLFTMYKGRIRLTTPMLWFMGFVVTFTIGGVTGVMLAIPPADFQFHNSLFLVAHFHNVIIGGVVFGYFAGITYWLPKIFGFKLHEKLGTYSIWLWIVGFVLAFVPLYALGLMGATRRLNTYDASLGWQWLFIVAGIGACIIALAIGLQLVQVGYSIFKRKQLAVGGDPWDGRTLEWSTPSPVPAYNFAVIPQVDSRDQFWVDKQRAKQKGATQQKPVYSAITLPKNTGAGLIIATFVFLFGFAAIWHMAWLAATALIGAIATLVIRSMQAETEEYISAAEVAEIENRIHARKVSA